MLLFSLQEMVASRHVCIGSVSAQQDVCTTYFDTWPEQQQTAFVERLLSRMCHFQQGQINNYLLQILQRDFISSLPGRVISRPRTGTAVSALLPCVVNDKYRASLLANLLWTPGNL